MHGGSSWSRSRNGAKNCAKIRLLHAHAKEQEERITLPFVSYYNRIQDAKT